MELKPERKIIHISDKTDFNNRLIIEFSKFGYLIINEIDQFNPIDSFSKEVAIVIVSSQFDTQLMYKMFKQLKESHYSYIPILALVATESKTNVKNILKMGYSDYIPVDIQPFEIVEKVVHFLSKYDFKDLSLKDISITIIDDDTFHTQLLSSVLRQKGATKIIHHKSGEAYFKSPAKADIFIVDIIMDKISGIRVIQEIRDSFPNTLIFGVSGVSDDRVIITALLNGANDFFVKPINTKIFLAKILAHNKYMKIIE